MMLDRRTFQDAQLASGGRPLRAAEFFAGVGLVRCGLEQAGIEVVWANDIEPTKLAVYAANFDACHYRLDDVRNIEGGDIPSVDLAAASFPCVDLSLAGNRRGLSGEQSGLFYEFTRILGEMGPRMPPVVLVENVASFVSSHGGEDLRAAVSDLNSLGYVCDLLILDARGFTPQSRPRLFMIGTLGRVAPHSHGAADLARPGPKGHSVADPARPAPQGHGAADTARPAPVAAFVQANRDLLLQQLPLPAPPRTGRGLDSIVERLHRSDRRWWDDERLGRFVQSLSALQSQRLDRLRSGPRLTWRTAYRRTRAGRAVWEIRNDDIAGCLRTARGGSSRQAVVEAGRGAARVRWMTPREYARLQGAPEGFDFSAVSEAQALYGFGDAVCVPVIRWLAEHALVPSAAALPPAAAAA